MFIHAVLLEIKPKQVRAYRRDSAMWARYAARVKGFISCYTLKRDNARNQFMSVYLWKTKAGHLEFMKKYHNWLAQRSRTKAKVLGEYYNFTVMDQFKR